MIWYGPATMPALSGARSRVLQPESSGHRGGTAGGHPQRHRRTVRGQPKPLEAANPQMTNPDVILAGQVIHIP